MDDNGRWEAELGREEEETSGILSVSTSVGDDERIEDRVLTPSKIVPSLLRRERLGDSSGWRKTGECLKEASLLVLTVSAVFELGEESAL